MTLLSSDIVALSFTKRQPTSLCIQIFGMCMWSRFVYNCLLSSESFEV